MSTINILVTGITGFVGQNLAPYLIETGRYRLYGHSRNPEAIKEMYPQVTVAPIKLDKEWLKANEINVIIHLAGIAHDLSGRYQEQDYYRVNRDDTVKLFRKFQEVNPHGKFIYLSSIKALTDHSEKVLMEEMPPDPKTPYGKSKQEAESILLAAAKEMQVYILRPCMIYGPGNKGNLNLLYQFVKKGLPWPLAGFDNKRSFLSVENLNMVIHHFATQQITPGIYHVANDDAVSTNVLVEWIGEAIGKSVRMWSLSPQWIQRFAAFGGKVGLPFNEARLNKLTENYVVSNQKLRQNMIDLPEMKTKSTLIKTIQSFHG
ncbi:MAG TPA: nucleoside-diphosphate-sugar epimerase [Cytophagales bacterium]|jgi:nucleoside-diphosphate-sugar epimerase|nr:nucleoside-diphosphate-sugar epimerase [Cytophagales bacterium]